MAYIKREGAAKYVAVDNEYFNLRKLRRYARTWSLWALGVGAVISGDFAGWNYGLAAGGTVGLLIAAAVVTILYFGLCYSVAEMSAALPHTGGAYSFGRTAFGPWGGFITGLAENMQYVLNTAATAVAIGGYLTVIFDTPANFAPAWWAAIYVIFVVINLWGIEVTLRFTVTITIIALMTLVLFYIFAIPKLDFHTFALNIDPSPGNGQILPFGMTGVAAAIPFAIWFYMAIEQLPLAAEEAHEPVKDVPKGMLLGLLTLMVITFATIIFGASLAPGASELSSAADPFLLGLKTIVGDDGIATTLSFLAIAGLVASFHSIMFAYGRNIYSLGRAGYFPKWLSLTHKTRHTPHIALIAGSIIGYIIIISLHFFGGGHLLAALLYMTVFGGMISYIMQMLAFLKLRSSFSNIDRPYVSILGRFGALVALCLSAATLIFCFFDPQYRSGLYGCLVWFAIGIAFFAISGQKRLVISPEEEFALRYRGADQPVAAE